VQDFFPQQIAIDTGVLLGVTGFLLALIILFVVLFVRTTRRIIVLQANFNELNKNLQHTHNKMETMIHQHSAVVDNIKSVELVVSRDVDALRHELIRQVEKIFDLSNEEMARNTEVLIPRLEAYKGLWEITETISNATENLDTNGKNNVLRDMQAWYFDDGNGLFLSTEAADSYRKAIRALKKSHINDIKTRFSDLRAQLKSDLAIYDELDTEHELENLSA
jgi:hypothetical protein